MTLCEEKSGKELSGKARERCLDTVDPGEKQKQRGRGEREETSATGLLLLGRTGVDKAEAENTHTRTLQVKLCTSCTCRAVTMGLAGRAVGMLGVSRGALLFSLWRIALLFLSIWELDAQTAVETKPLYIWQTGMLLLWHQRDSFSQSGRSLSQKHREKERQITLTCLGAARDSASVEITQSNMSYNQHLMCKAKPNVESCKRTKKLKLLRKEIQIMSLRSVRYERHLALLSLIHCHGERLRLT
ncbi:hypothetical protein D9C73_022800 [Collichthys lucidus]|uniref:Uncharacterized protein n=1 Tax=Collichthys lucidus TaxID=240159 RepID=A0A4U5VKM4_COLLU|nr:hypothetical protein D9C73_022800 [Collichthys lucidus]